MKCADLISGLESTGTGQVKLARLRQHVEQHKYSHVNDAALLFEDFAKIPGFAEGTVAKMRALLRLTPTDIATLLGGATKENLKTFGLDKAAIRTAMKSGQSPEEELASRRERLATTVPIVPKYEGGKK